MSRISAHRTLRRHVAPPCGQAGSCQRMLTTAHAVTGTLTKPAALGCSCMRRCPGSWWLMSGKGADAAMHRPRSGRGSGAALRRLAALQSKHESYSNAASSAHAKKMDELAAYHAKKAEDAQHTAATKLYEAQQAATAKLQEEQHIAASKLQAAQVRRSCPAHTVSRRNWNAASLNMHVMPGALRLAVSSWAKAPGSSTCCRHG